MSRDSDGQLGDRAVGTHFWAPEDSAIRALWESSDRLIASMALDGSFLRQNPAWHAALGYSREEATQLKIFDILHPDSHDHCRDLFHRLISGAPQASLEAILVAKDGRSLHVRGTAEAAIRDGDLVGVVSSLFDVTEEVDRESLLQESKRSEQQSALLLELVKAKIENPKQFEEFHQTALEGAASILEVERCSFWLFEDEGESLNCVDLFLRSEGVHTSGAVLERGDFPAYFEAIENQRVVLAHDAMTDPATVEFAGSYLPEHGIVSMLDAPLRRKGNVVGLLCCEHVGEPREWRTGQSQFAIELAAQLSRGMGELDETITQKALADRERQLEVILGSTADGIITISEKGIIQTFNRSAERLFGYGEEEVLHKNVSILMPEEDARRHDDYGRYLATGEARVIGSERVVVGLRKDGSTFPMALRATESRDGEERTFIGTVQDVSERVRAEGELRTNQSMLRAIASAQANVLSGKTGARPFDEVLDSFLEVTESEYGFIGEVRHDEKGQPYQRTHALTNIAWDTASRAFHDEHKEAGLEFRNLDTLFGAVLRTEETLFANDPAAHPESGGLPEGHPPMTAFLGIPLKVGEKLVGMVGLANRPSGYDEKLVDAIEPMVNTAVSLIQYDTTQASLRASIATKIRAATELRQLIDTANAPIFGIDPMLLVTEWNQKAEEITGFGKDEVMGHALVEEFIAEEYRESVRSVLQEALEGTDTANFEFPLFTKSGERVDLLLNATTRRDVEGTITGVIGIGQDITERKKAEEDLEQERGMLAERVTERTAELSLANAELARASRAKDEFLASMSHELRTPLNAILSSAESLEEGIYGKLAERQMRPVQLIGESGRHLLSLINDILDLSKVEAGMIDLDLGPVIPEEVAQASLNFVKEAAQKKRIRISTHIHESIPTIQADGRRLKQILVNLLSNAVKFTPEGGTVGLEITADPEQDAIQLVVWDTGIGISAEDQLKLFKPFTQLDAGLDREYSGTGLGLALVARMTELHGGSVSVESPGRGQGTRFTVSLPRVRFATTSQAEAREEEGATEGGPEAAIKDPESPQAGAPALILMAEDNEANIESMSAFLQAKGFRLIVARNGEEAVTRTRKEHPDLILMDIQMPKVDGLEAIGQIRKDPEFDSIPIIAVTALVMEGDRERCLAAGANEYLTKPLSLKGLVSTINRMLEGEP